MSEKNSQTNEGVEKKRVSKMKKEKNLAKSSKLGFFTVFTCVAIFVVALLVTVGFDPVDKPQPNFVPADSVKVSALSTSWSCPIAGGNGTSDSIVVSNPDMARSANVEISIFDALGKKVNSEITKVEPNSFLVRNASSLRSNNQSTVFVESFSAPVAVFRSLNLSDGEELVGCVNDLGSKASFPNLTTIRNANSVIVLSNPYDEAVVVDVTANLFNTAEESSIPVLDDVKGQIIPAKGRLDLNLQSLFGRFDVASVDVVSRSGFFASEALITYAGAQNITGQTVVSAARDLSATKKLSWTGINPTRIVAKNGSVNTHSLNFVALALDNRSLSPEPKIMAAGTTSVLENLGADFGSRTITLSVEAGPNKPRDIYAAWLHASANAVSSGSQEGQNSRNHLVPVSKTSRLIIFNSGKKEAKVEYSILGSSKIKTSAVETGTFKVIDLADLNIESVSIIKVDSNQNVVISSSSPGFSNFAPSVEVLP